MMELKELVIKTLDIFEVKSEDALSEKIFDAVKQNNTEKFAQFRELVGDLSIDWLQMIYQYYLADRKEKMQDYTPKSRGECAWDVKGGIDYNGYITTSRNNRKPSEISKKNQRTDKKRGSSRARHEGGKTARS